MPAAVKFWFAVNVLSGVLPYSLSSDECFRRDRWMRMQGKRTGNIFFWRIISSAFQAGFWRRFTPQNKFCGYEDSAFQAKILSNTEISIAVEAFNSPANLCLKGNNLHNRQVGDLRTKMSLQSLPERQNYCSCIEKYLLRRKGTNETKIHNLKFLFLYFLLILNYGITPSKQSP